MIVWPAKDPAEVLDFSWTVPLDPDDFIGTFTASLSSGSVALGIQDQTETVGIVWISGGAADELAYVNLRAVTDAGRTFRDVAVLPLIDRASAVLADFRLRYPAFVSIADGPIGFWLAKAGAEVGDTWPEDVRTEAKGAWAAHKLMESGVLQSMPSGVTSFKSADFSASFSDAVAGRTGYDSTIYGREFKRLQRRCFGGPRLAWTPPYCV